jgi:hypothetical protein
MTSKQTFFTTIVAILFIAVAVASRLLPHPLNFTPLTAIALFGGVYLNKRLALVIPLAALFISDAFLGFYDMMPWVYGSFLAAGIIGIMISGRKSVLSVSAATLASSLLFFAVTNFGVWAGGTMYVHSWAGLTECYVAAIPFFRNSIAGDAIFVTAMFGFYEMALRYAKRTADRVTVRS